MTNLTATLTHISSRQCGIKRKNFDGVYETSICLKGGTPFNASQWRWIHITKRLGPYRLRKKRLYAVFSDHYTIPEKFYRRKLFDTCYHHNVCVDFTSEDYDKWQKCYKEKGPYILTESNVFPFYTWTFSVNPFAKQASILRLMRPI